MSVFIEDDLLEHLLTDKHLWGNKHKTIKQCGMHHCLMPLALIMSFWHLYSSESCTSSSALRLSFYGIITSNNDCSMQ